MKFSPREIVVSESTGHLGESSEEDYQEVFYEHSGVSEESQSFPVTLHSHLI